MRWLLFLSRLAFICGLFLLVSISLLIHDWAQEQALVSTIIIIGTVLGVIAVPVVNICYLWVLLVKRRLGPYVPAWLVVANILFLCLYILYALYSSHG